MTEQKDKVLSSANSGDERTPDKTIGEVKYAHGEDKTTISKVSAAKNRGLQDDHDPNDIGQRTANKPKAEKSQMEGPAAYAPHDESEEEGREAGRRDEAEGGHAAGCGQPRRR